MDKRIIIRVEDETVTIAIAEDRRLVELYIESEDTQRIVGNIYKGKVSNVLAGMQSAFVDVGLDRDVFLHVGDLGTLIDERDEDGPPPIQDVLEIGQEIIIQIAKEPIGTKGARGTTALTLPGRYSVLMPGDKHVGVSRKVDDEEERERLKTLGDAICPEGVGLIIRTVAAGRTEEEIRLDVEFLHSLWKKIQNRIQRVSPSALIHNELSLPLKVARDLFTPDVAEVVIDHRSAWETLHDFFSAVMPDELGKLVLFSEPVDVFERYGVNRAIEKLLQPKVWLDCGGYLIIQKTEALTAIDVNTGKFTGKGSLEETVFKTNMEAAAEIGRQIRLRDIGGIIIVDFIDMEEQEHKDQVLAAIKESLSRDKTKSNLSGITEFGLVEITRRRVGKSLLEVLQQPCESCNGSGRVLASGFISQKVREVVTRMTAAARADLVTVRLHPDVAHCLTGHEEEKLKRLEKKTGAHIHVVADDHFHVEEIHISTV